MRLRIVFCLLILLVLSAAWRREGRYRYVSSGGVAPHIHRPPPGPRSCLCTRNAADTRGRRSQSSAVTAVCLDRGHQSSPVFNVSVEHSRSVEPAQSSLVATMVFITYQEGISDTILRALKEMKLLLSHENILGLEMFSFPKQQPSA